MTSRLLPGASATGAGTLVSRVLGMLRDMATAWLLGLSGGVMDAFAVAFRGPELFRRLFTEGALAAGYLPAIAAEIDRDQPAAWRLASTTLAAVAIALGAAVVLVELLLAAAAWAWGDRPDVFLTLGLAAVMAPYAVLVTLAAFQTATLHALGRFALPAFVPVVLNVAWLAAAWLAAPRFADQEARAYVLAVAVLVAGVIQSVVQWPLLRRLGFRPTIAFRAERGRLVRMAALLLPTVCGLAVTQINTLADSLLAWMLTDRGTGLSLQPGAAAAVYFAERILDFPVGLVGVAVATAVFPLLSRHAAQGNREGLRNDLALGLETVLTLGVPASAGMALLAEPIARLLFEHGEFGPGDTARAAEMIVGFSGGVWAYCAVPVVVRGFYALGDHFPPVAAGVAAIAANALVGLAVASQIGESGLAVGTSVAAVLQLIVLTVFLGRRHAATDWRRLAVATVRAAVATAAMSAAVGAARLLLEGRSAGRLAAVAVPMAAALAVYFAAHRLLGGRFRPA